jgi:hypothetical protein
MGNRINLEKAVVVGFFSLPPSSLAESNPAAYNNAMAGAPEGAGTCAVCGTGILHHVVIEIDSARHFIGSDCAERVGSPALARCVKARMTAEEMAAKDERQRQEAARIAESTAAFAAKVAARSEELKDIILPLESGDNKFYCSLAAQLRHGPLSEKQANYVCKALVGRLSKKTDAQWTVMFNRVTKATAG